MINYTKGNLLEASAEALVNTVNEVGVMGKGIALMFKEAFPENARDYADAAKRHEIQVGKVFVTENPSLVGPRYIINFPTKKHWRHPSKLEWVREGLRDLVRVVQKLGIKSVALPPLGCGNGGLDWSHVKLEIEAAASKVPGVQFVVFEPIDTYQNAPKRSGVDELTPARALIAELIRRYSILGLECTNLEVHKLAWFLHRVITGRGLHDPLDLRFQANKYGPYADRLRHLLNGLDGSYLHCEKRLSDAGPFDAIWFEDSKRDEVDAYLSSTDAQPYRAALDETTALIDGFESPFGMELLATVDWLMVSDTSANDIDAIRQALGNWPGGRPAARRKQQLFDDKMLAIALRRLAAA